MRRRGGGVREGVATRQPGRVNGRCTSQWCGCAGGDSRREIRAVEGIRVFPGLVIPCRK
jgi:hypothetical protein